MTNRKAGFAHHPAFGPIPAWCTATPWRALLLIIAGGMALGIGLMMLGLTFLLAEPTSEFARTVAALALTSGLILSVGGSLFGTVFFVVLQMWQRRLRKLDATAIDA